MLGFEKTQSHCRTATVSPRDSYYSLFLKCLRGNDVVSSFSKWFFQNSQSYVSAHLSLPPGPINRSIASGVLLSSTGGTPCKMQQEKNEQKKEIIFILVSDDLSEANTSSMHSRTNWKCPFCLKLPVLFNFCPNLSSWQAGSASKSQSQPSKTSFSCAEMLFSCSWRSGSVGV